MKHLFFIIALLLFSGVGYSQDEEAGDHEVDSIIHLLNQHRQKDTIRLNLLLNLVGKTTGENLVNFCDEGLELSDLLLSKPNKEEVIRYLKKSKATLYSKYAEYCEGNAEMLKSIELFQKSFDLSKEINDKMAMATMLNNMAVIYTDQANIKQALENYNTIMKIFEDIGYKEGIANTLNNLGYLYNHMKEVKKAIEYYERSIAVWSETSDEEGLATAYNNLGQDYSQLKKFDKALELFDKSLDLYTKQNNQKGISYCLTNMAIVYGSLGDTTTALEYYYKGLEIREKIGDKRAIANSYYNIGCVMERKGDVKLAKDYAIKSLELAREVGFPSRIQRAAELLNRIYKKQKKYKEALEMFELSVTMRDSLMNQENRKAEIQQQFKYEYEKKVAADSIKQMAQIKIEEARHEHEIAKQRTITYAGIAGGILMLIIAAISFRAYRQKRKDHQLIEAQKHLVEEKQKEILDSIRYAKRIQNSLLPNEKIIERQLNDLNKSN